MIAKIADWLLAGAPTGVRRRFDDAVDVVHVAREVQNPQVLVQMIPSVARGLLVKKGKQHAPVRMRASHSAYFDFEYRGEFPEMYDLYRRAVKNQWDAETQLDWSIDVDPMNPEVPILARDFVPFETIEELGFHLNADEKRRFTHSIASWILSQFLHGEQGALYAAAQVTESVEWLDAKFYGSTQVMDEGRHVEVFYRYLETKLGKLYQVNDNLYVILDQLMTDSRWDMKFLGMQIMVEGLALGAFGLIYGSTGEPLLKELLRYVIQDEARHVHYGVLALKKHFAEALSEKERREREDWCFEIALLMRNRFLAHEVYEEWFEGRISRAQWDEVFGQVPYMQKFRSTMFKRLIPNLEYIGLLTPRVQHLYERAGLMTFSGGKNASQLTAEDLLDELG
jgi:hypothetical protein